jgi:hypothetical protein
MLLISVARQLVDGTKARNKHRADANAADRRSPGGRIRRLFIYFGLDLTALITTSAVFTAAAGLAADVRRSHRRHDRSRRSPSGTICRKRPRRPLLKPLSTSRCSDSVNTAFIFRFGPAPNLRPVNSQPEVEVAPVITRPAEPAADYSVPLGGRSLACLARLCSLRRGALLLAHACQFERGGHGYHSTLPRFPTPG